MTELLKHAFQQATQELNETEQDLLATFLLQNNLHHLIGHHIHDELSVRKVCKPLPFAKLAALRAKQTLSTKPSLEDVQAIRQDARYY